MLGDKKGKRDLPAAGKLSSYIQVTDTARFAGKNICQMIQCLLFLLNNLQVSHPQPTANYCCLTGGIAQCSPHFVLHLLKFTFNFVYCKFRIYHQLKHLLKKTPRPVVFHIPPWSPFFAFLWTLLQWWANIVKLVQTNIRMHLDAQELTEWIFEYNQMSKIWPNKYPNMFGCPRFYRTNIWIYSDGGKAKNMKTFNICRQFYYNIDHSNLCVLIKTGQNTLNLVIHCPKWSKVVSIW